VPRREQEELAFRVTVGGKKEIAARRIDLRQEADSRPALKALFGARRVRGLEYLLHGALPDLREQLARLGYDPAGVLTSAGKVYAENQLQASHQAVRDLLVREALAYGLASAETAFVGVRVEAGRPVEGTVVVANALPAGWSERMLGPGSTLMACMAVFDSSMIGYSDPSLAMSAPAAPPRSARRSAKFLGGITDAVKSVASACFDLGNETAAARPAATVVFSGVPAFSGGEAILFDSARDSTGKKLPNEGTISRLRLSFPDGAPDPASLDAGLCLLVFVDDLASPRARVRLADLVRHSGERPLNLRRRPGQVVRLTLIDPAGSWARKASQLEVTLG
jgi:Ca-activated chloride channel family protein